MQETISYKTIFGPIVMNLLENSNEWKVRQESKAGIDEAEEHKSEDELFEIIDDYIEQA